MKKEHKEYLTLEPDIQQNQKINKIRLNELRSSVTDKELKDLLYKREHYFDTGFFVPMTPEELDGKIKEKFKEIEKEQ